MKASLSRLAHLLCIVLFTGLASAQEPDPGASTVSARPTIPQHWRSHFIAEHVFNGTVFVTEAGKRGAPVVILIHGLGQAGLTDWLNVVPALEANYHVIALDLPGFGRSSSPQGKYSPTNYARVVHEIKELFSKGPVKVVGHSMGGAVALRYTADFPEHVTSAVLVDAAGILNRTAFVKHSAGAVVGNYEMPWLLEGFRGLLGRYAEDVMETVGSWPDPTGLLGEFELLWGRIMLDKTNINAALALVNEDFTEAVLQNNTPIQIIWGRNDTVAPLRTGTMLAHRLPNAQLHIIDDAEHVPMNTHPMTFNKLLLEALTTEPNNPDPILEKRGSLEITGKRGGSYSGAYEEIEIRDSYNVRLTSLSAKKLTVINSDITLENVSIIANDGLAALIERSRVLATNLHITAAQGMMLSDASLDIAGLELHTTGVGIEAVFPSEAIFSISRIETKFHRRNLHGQFALTPGVVEIQPL